MPELDSITVKGFKSIAAIEELSLGPVNVLIGPNGSGKSNFIGVFSFLHAVGEGQLQEYVARAGGAEKVLHFGSKVTKKLEIHISFQGGRHEYEIAFFPTDADELAPGSEAVYFWDRALHPERREVFLPLGDGTEAQISNVHAELDADSAVYVREHLGRWQVYHLRDTSSSSPMKKTTDLNDNRYLRPDGSNLAAFLYYLKVKEEASYNLIRRTVQQVAPFFDDFVLEPLRLNPKTIMLEWRHKGSDAYFDASSLSDGTLRFMALTTLFLQAKALRPSVILVDEPELGLHPAAITLLAALVKQASVETQVLISTQSSLLLDHFEPEDVLVADRVEGGTQFSRLDPAALEEWLEDYSLGQLWEKNELGGRPARE